MSHAFLGVQNNISRTGQKVKDPQRTSSTRIHPSDVDEEEKVGSILLTIESTDGATYKLKVNQLTTGQEIKVKVYTIYSNSGKN